MKKALMVSLALVAFIAIPSHAKKHAYHAAQPVHQQENQEQVYRKCVGDAETVLGLKVANADTYLKSQGWTLANPGKWQKAGHSLLLTERNGKIGQTKIVK
ncbi:hypothetical protein [Kluyvera sichuanensis]|uniref:hypothetical protein n=1 Tax=Kluyvera sichuanensis TaxID=2725494 RepID=UPI002FD0980C